MVFTYAKYHDSNIKKDRMHLKQHFAIGLAALLCITLMIIKGIVDPMDTTLCYMVSISVAVLMHTFIYHLEKEEDDEDDLFVLTK